MSETKTQSDPEVRETETVDLDCSGLLCPLPVYKAAIVLNRLDKGDVLRLVTTDPGALRDIPAMANQRGDTLLSIAEDEGHQIFHVQKGVSS